MTERVAVIIPCFNDGPLLAETIASIDEREPLDLVVVDDGSTDSKTVDTIDRLEADGVRVVRHEVNRGLVYARATGLEETTAPFVFPLDSDDLAVPGAFGRMADRLDGVPEAVVCYGDYDEFGTRKPFELCPPRSIPTGLRTRTSTRSRPSFGAACSTRPAPGSSHSAATRTGASGWRSPSADCPASISVLAS